MSQALFGLSLILPEKTNILYELILWLSSGLIILGGLCSAAPLPFPSPSSSTSWLSPLGTQYPTTEPLNCENFPRQRTARILPTSPLKNPLCSTSVLSHLRSRGAESGRVPGIRLNIGGLGARPHSVSFSALRSSSTTPWIGTSSAHQAHKAQTIKRTKL